MRSWWGPWFPDAVSPKRWLGPWFPDGSPDPVVIPPVPPVGVATFALDLESGSQLTMSWITDIIKSYAGLETRSSSLDAPKRKIAGQAYLIGDATRSMRARIARYAAIGSPFTLALPYEELTLIDDSVGGQVFVASTANADWAVLGTTVVVRNGQQTIQGVVQAVDSGSITLDVSPGALGISGGSIMPCIAVFLDPQQGFARFPGRKSSNDDPDIVELWAVNCTAIPFGFESSARAAFAALTDSTGALHDMVILFPTIGPFGNMFSLTVVGDSVFDTGDVTLSGDAYTFHFKIGVTTVADLVASDVGTFFGISGSYDPTAVLIAGDAIGPVFLMNGADKNWGTMGAGAALMTYAGRPVWDRRIQVDGTVLDSVQSLTEIIDMGGVPINIGSALRSDWGRGVLLRGETLPVPPTHAFGARTDDNGEIDVTSIPAGTIGNGRTVELIADGAGTGTYVDGDAAEFHFENGVTTYADMAAAGASSSRFTFSVFRNGPLQFGSTITLHGATDETMSPLWQWLKLFLSTVQGRRRAFWLPTWRNDLAALEIGTNSITIEGPGESSGDFFAWYPSLRDRIQTIEDDGTVTYTQITGATDNGDGTVTLTIAATLASVPTLVSWLELCRFESDDFPVKFTGSWIEFSGIAHVVTQ